MTCREFVDFLMAYLEGELEPGRRAEFESHLAACPRCRTYLDTYRETVDLLETLCGDGPEGPVPEVLVRAVLAARRARS